MSQQWNTPPEMQIDVSKTYSCSIETDKGTIQIDLFADAAPNTVNNFVFLANAGYYDGVTFHRVIDNAEIRMTGEEFWVHLNYHLIHLLDFLPVANWPVQANDTSFIVFRSLYRILEKSGRLEVQLDYQPASKRKSLLPHATGEDQSLPGWLTTLIPVGASEKMAALSIQRFSERIGHSLSYEMSWKA